MTSSPEAVNHCAPYFDRRTTNIIKGIALILMFIHHFFTFPETFVEGISYPGAEAFAAVFRQPTKICVPVFAFLTGYLYFFQPRKTFSYSIKKILDLFIPYWVVFLTFVAIKTLAGHSFSLQRVIMELFTLRTSVMVFCWYVQFYLVSMLILPVLTKFLPQASKAMSFFAGLFVFPLCCSLLQRRIQLSVVQSVLSTLLQWFPCIVIGYLFAQHNLFRHWMDNLFSTGHGKVGQRVIWVLLVIAACYCRRNLYSFIPGTLIHQDAAIQLDIPLDILFAPCFVYGIARLVQEGTLRLHRVLESIGRRSMLMWFLHCIFFNSLANIFQPILYFPRNPIMVLIWGLLLCYGGAVVVDAVCKPLIRWKNKLLNL